jgi:hypothetical protein
MIADTIAAFRASRSPTDFYRCQINFEMVASPPEFAALYDQAAVLPGPAKTWAASIAKLMFFENQQLQEFRREAIGSYVTLYVGERAGKADKELIVGFTAFTSRLGLPACAVLQYFQDDRHDVVLLQMPLFSFFLRGIPGYAQSMSELIARLLSDLDPTRYRGVRTVGLSAGGAAALRAAVALAAVRGVAVSPVTPHSPGNLVSAPLEAHALAELVTPWTGVDPNKTTLVCAYPESSENDVTHAKRIVGDGPVELLPYPSSDHNLIFDLLKRSQLRRFVDEVVLA